MKNNTLVELIRSSESRKMAIELTKSKIRLEETEISKIDQKIKKIEEVLEKELQEYRINFDKNRDRVINNADFQIIDQIHRHRINSMHLKRLSFEMKKDSKKSLIQRSLCLCWLLKLPNGLEKVEMVENKSNLKAIINRKDIYDKYFEVVMNSEKERLKRERSFYRLQLDFNNAPDYLVFNNHEFYAESELVSKKLEDVKDKIELLKNYENKIKGKYTDFIDYHKLTLGDFISDDEQLFDNLFLSNNENNIRRAM